MQRSTEEISELQEGERFIMTCEETQRLIKPYIRGELKTEEAAEFAEHVSGCKQCKDELEVSYCLTTAIRQLNEDEEFSGNYIQELNNLLLETVKEAKRERKMITRKRIWVFAEAVILALLIGI